MRPLFLLLPIGLSFGCVESRRLALGFVSFEEEGKAAAAATLSPTFDGADTARKQAKVSLKLVAGGVRMPTDVQPVPDLDGVLLVLTKDGDAYLVDAGGGKKPKKLFSVAVRTPVEMGLLGIAFHPKFASDRRFYLNYNPDSAQETRIAEWEWPKGGTPHEKRVLFTVDQPYQNHNGGQLQFGPDGGLYVGLGDGGWMDDPHGNGQNPRALLGKMLRVDVDAKKPKPEVWAKGLRNPWRFTFAPDGRMVVADVGQNRREELDLIGKGDNAGWAIMEGRSCHEPKSGCNEKGLVKPFYEYGRGDGNSVTGGCVVTGDAVPALKGKYVFGDFGTGRIWAVDLPEDAQKELKDADVLALGRFGLNVSTFGCDAKGRLYVGAFDAGAVYVVSP